MDFEKVLLELCCLEVLADLDDVEVCELVIPVLLLFWKYAVVEHIRSNAPGCFKHQNRIQRLVKAIEADCFQGVNVDQQLSIALAKFGGKVAHLNSFQKVRFSYMVDDCVLFLFSAFLRLLGFYGKS